MYGECTENVCLKSVNQLDGRTLRCMDHDIRTMMAMIDIKGRKPSGGKISLTLLRKKPPQKKKMEIMSTSASGSFYFRIVVGCIVALVVYYSWIEYLVVTISRRKTIRQQYGCKPPPAHRHPAFDIFGLHEVKETMRAFESKTVISRQIAQFEEYGTTFSSKLFGTSVINTADPENVREVLSTSVGKYSIGARRQSAFAPLVGQSLFQVEGSRWKRARTIYRSCLTKSQMEDVGLFEKHVQKLLDVLVRHGQNGQVVNLGDWFPRLTADVATDSFFGLSIGSLIGSEKFRQDEGFLQAMNHAQVGCERRWKIGVFANLFPHKGFRKSLRRVFTFIDGHIQTAMEMHQLSLKKESRRPEDDLGERRVFLHELCKMTDDRQLIRDEVLAIFIAGVDTTAALLTNLFFVLAKRPDVWQKLREEAQLLKREPPTINQTRALKYHESCILECETCPLFSELCFLSRLC